MVEEKRNVMYFYDDSIGIWVKAPAAWEAKTDFLRPIVAEVKTAIPSWKDDIDIVAALRQSGYDPDDAIATYITVGLDDALVAASTKGTSSQQADLLKKQVSMTKYNPRQLVSVSFLLYDRKLIFVFVKHPNHL